MHFLPSFLHSLLTYLLFIIVIIIVIIFYWAYEFDNEYKMNKISVYQVLVLRWLFAATTRSLLGPDTNTKPVVEWCYNITVSHSSSRTVAALDADAVANSRSESVIDVVATWFNRWCARFVHLIVVAHHRCATNNKYHRVLESGELHRLPHNYFRHMWRSLNIFQWKGGGGKREDYSVRSRGKIVVGVWEKNPPEVDDIP